MFLVPSSSRVVDHYLQTLLLRVSLSRLGGKHRHPPLLLWEEASICLFSLSHVIDLLLGELGGALSHCVGLVPYYEHNHSGLRLVTEVDL